MKFSPYLFFTTQCEAALAFYEACGLGRTTFVMRYGDGGMPVHNEAMRGKIMHSRFEGPVVVFYASDNDDAEPMKGFALMIEMADRVALRALFHKMGEGGRITTAFGRQVWGDDFGKIVDRFGVQWMFNCAGARL